MKGNWVLVMLMVALLFCICVYNKKDTNRQNFQLLGAAGPYQAQYVQCINECQREDPGDRLGVNNLTCGYYCDAVITKFIEKGIPPENIPLKDNLIECKEECKNISFEGATKEDIRKCVSTCYGAKEVNQWCREEKCPYSTFPQDLCLNMCTSEYGSNNNQNSWKWGRFG